MHTYIRTYIHTYIHTSIHTYIHTYRRSKLQAHNTHSGEDLWELELELGARRALLLQALIFAALHPWHQLPGLAAIGMFGGVLLLGLALALQRRADAGRLWGAMGLHGGLVGGWFVLQSGVVEVMPQLPVVLGGSGGAGAPNPLAGVAGWLGLGLLLLRRRRWW